MWTHPVIIHFNRDSDSVGSFEAKIISWDILNQSYEFLYVNVFQSWSMTLDEIFFSFGSDLQKKLIAVNCLTEISLIIHPSLLAKGRSMTYIEFTMVHPFAPRIYLPHIQSIVNSLPELIGYSSLVRFTGRRLMVPIALITTTALRVKQIIHCVSPLLFDLSTLSSPVRSSDGLSSLLGSVMMA